MMSVQGQKPGDSPLRIAFIVPEDRKTGTYFRSHNLAIGLSRLGHSLTVYSQSNENRLGVSEERRDGVRYVFFPTVPGNRFVIAPVNPANIARRLCAEIGEHDVYHLFQPFPSAALPWLALRERREGVFAYDWDDFWINEEFGLKRPRGANARMTALWVSFLEQYLPAKCDVLTTLSHGLSGLAHRWRSAHSSIVYNGVWPERPLPRDEARRILGLKPDALYVGMMGWSGEMEWALEGIRRSAGSFDRLRLAMCGQDPAKFVEAFPDIRDRVDVLGYLQENRLTAFRSSIDLGLIPMADSDFNQFRLPYKLTDFLAAGTPVLASGVGETTVVADMVPGIRLCPPNREGWLSAFNRTVSDLNQSSRPSRVDQTRLLEHFDWMRIAERLVKAYRGAFASTAAERLAV